MKTICWQTILCLIIGLTVSSCGEEEKKEEKVLRPVRYEMVGFSNGANQRTFSGTANTDKVINLSFRNTGIITELNIKLGQKVKKGALLAKLDNVQARLSHESALASLNSAASQMNTAKLNLNRVRALYEKGSASLSDYENAKNSFRTAQASHESAKRSVDIQKEQIRYGYLYAPENGVIAAVNVEIDENINPGQPVAVLNAGAKMEITIGLPENVINRVKKGMEVDVTFAALKSQDFKGKVTEISPAVAANSATYPVKVHILKATEDIRSGMAANVTFNFGNETTSNALVVPAKAVGEDGDGNFVFLIENGADANTGTVKKQRVKIGTLTSKGFEIKEGLNEGQRIATAGLQTLLDGQEVKLQ